MFSKKYFLICLLICLVFLPQVFSVCFAAPRVKKTVISSTKDKTTSTNKSSFIKSWGFAFHYTNNTATDYTAKPSLPYIELLLENEHRIAFTMNFTKKASKNHFLINASYLFPLFNEKHNKIQYFHGIDFLMMDGALDLFSFGYLFGAQKELLPSLSLGLQLEPFVFLNNSTSDDSYLTLNKTFSTYLALSF